MVFCMILMIALDGEHVVFMDIGQNLIKLTQVYQL